MDSGPIDAGPSADREYHYNNPELESPRDERRNNPSNAHISPAKKPHLRDSYDGSSYDADQRRSRHHSRQDLPRQRRMSSQSAGSFDDPPLYPRVGAIEDSVLSDEATKLKAESTSKQDDDESPPHRIYKYTLYETNTRYWITGADILDKRFRLLRIDRNSPPGQIVLFEDETIYDRKRMNDVLATIDEGNRATGGLKKRYSFWGLLGFIRFTEAYYMVVITKRLQVAMIGGHYVYQIEGTELVPLTTGASSRFARDRNAEETRFLGIFNNLDLHRSFYFSYSYDITNSLQTNLIRQRQAVAEGRHHPDPEFNAMFVWNHHLLKPALPALNHPFDWCLPIIHGYIDQTPLDIFGRCIYVTVIGRRSRFFAGARFLKRGVNDQGYVANDVETEQIVAEKLTTSFHAPGPRLFSNPTYTSFVQHRGSIPLYWTQETNNMTPKPDISVSLQDPFYEPAALHFDNLFERYGCPVYVLNLIKGRERQPRESKLLSEYESCVKYLNQSLPADKKILYRAYDMARAAKGRNSDVMRELEVIAREMVAKTGFFHNGEEGYSDLKVQNGIARTNCIDCLDRTNSAQFVIGKHALALQLNTLGVFDRDEVEYDTDAANVFTQMFHDHGDTIAMQYGGSHLVNTVATYRKLNHWQSSSRDAIENLKRYYNNSFMDSQRQEAYNLFLGNYVWAQGEPMLWDLTTDYYLHHSDPKAWLDRRRRNYVYWFTPEFLEARKMPVVSTMIETGSGAQSVTNYDEYWLECYRPTVVSSLSKVFAFRLTTEPRYLPERFHREKMNWNFSPFVRRLDPHRHHSTDSPEKVRRRGVKIVDPSDDVPSSAASMYGDHRPMIAEDLPSILKEPTFERSYLPLPAPVVNTPKMQKELDKNQMHLWTMNQFYHQSLDPSVPAHEALEYQRYIDHPLSLPLVVSNELPSDANIDYLEYVHKVGGGLAFEEFGDPEDELLGISEQDLQQFRDHVLNLPVDPLTVTEEDAAKKRYKAYRQWLKGKSLFKQSKVDPEYVKGA